MDHGNPSHRRRARCWFCSDEHVTFAAREAPRVGDRVRVWPAHVDPTVAYHERMHLVAATRSSTSCPSTCAAGEAAP